MRVLLIVERLTEDMHGPLGAGEQSERQFLFVDAGERHSRYLSNH